MRNRRRGREEEKKEEEEKERGKKEMRQYMREKRGRGGGGEVVGHRIASPHPHLSASGWRGAQLDSKEPHLDFISGGR